MHIHMPDPYPGRCQNVRHNMHADSYVETLRCLEAEGTEHVCRFPESTHYVSAGEGQVYTTTAPQPWVVPPREPKEHPGTTMLRRTGWGSSEVIPTSPPPGAYC